MNNFRPGRTQRPPKDARPKTAPIKPMPELPPDRLRFIPLGGLGDIGRNMAAIEYGKDIIVIDCGMMMPRQDMLGVDFVIPNTKYLEDNKHRIRAMLITHGHEDHIGAVPYIAPKLGVPIYATKLAQALIEAKLQEFNIGNLRIHTIMPKDRLKFGAFDIEPFHVTHSIPDTVGFIIRTPIGNLVWLTDYKIDDDPIDGKKFDFETLHKAVDEGVLALFSDSTNAGKPGSTTSETQIGIMVEKYFRKASGRIIFSSFSSQVHRVQMVINAAESTNRKVAFSGRSMIKNVDIAIHLGYIKAASDTIVDIRKASSFRDDQVVIMCTGSQGQAYSALVRMAQGDHKQIQIKKGDSVIISSSVIPGNEEPFFDTVDDLYRRGATVVWGNEMDVHTSGHAQIDEITRMIQEIKPKFLVPIHGEYYHMVLQADLARSLGIPDKNIQVVENGNVVEISRDEMVRSTLRVPAGFVLVDGLGIGDVGNIVLRDRQAMASAGVVVAIVTLDKEGNLLTSPDVISRGFIYMRESEDLVQKIRQEIKNLIHKYYRQHRGDLSTLRSLMRDDLSRFVYNETKREPMVLPVIIEIKR